ncbi:MAG: hypothetical protein LBH92_02940 [Bacteroidales bacterium]|jgi:hypothetical protein|nr:hypothetical protein [Bacteroidales bacterium]
MKYRKTILFFCFWATLVTVIFTSSCRKDPAFNTDGGVKLAFSTDTVLFDTVFTTIGSSTRKLMVYNPYDEAVKISKIALAGGSSSPYMINIDGEYSTAIYDKAIEPKDSIYIFVKVRINPDDSNNPFFVQDSIIFNTNNNYQDVKLVACGQNANYILPDVFGQSFNYRRVEGVWTSERPYVIYDYAVIDSATTLVIEEGCQLYFHKNARLWVYEGTLHVNGTPENKIVFQSDRREQEFKNLPGQWDGILITNALNCFIQNAEIRNAISGIQCDGFVASSEAPTLQIINTKIENMSTGGIAGNGTYIVGANILIDKCYEYAMALCGGIFGFQHVTIANFVSTAEKPSMILQNYFEQYEGFGETIIVHKIPVAPTLISFENSIAWGKTKEEIVTKYLEGYDFNWSFDHSLLQTQRNLNESNFITCWANEDPLFVNWEEYDYKLDTLSPALDRGKPLPNIQTDINGFLRNPQHPDLGAYEMTY